MSPSRRAAAATSFVVMFLMILAAGCNKKPTATSTSADLDGQWSGSLHADHADGSASNLAMGLRIQSGGIALTLDGQSRPLASYDVSHNSVGFVTQAPNAAIALHFSGNPSGNTISGSMWGAGDTGSWSVTRQ